MNGPISFKKKWPCATVYLRKHCGRFRSLLWKTRESINMRAPLGSHLQNSWNLNFSSSESSLVPPLPGLMDSEGGCGPCDSLPAALRLLGAAACNTKSRLMHQTHTRRPGEIWSGLYLLSCDPLTSRLLLLLLLRRPWSLWRSWDALDKNNQKKNFFFVHIKPKNRFYWWVKFKAAYLLLFPLDFNDDVTLCLCSLSILDIFSLAFRFVVHLYAHVLW